MKNENEKKPFLNSFIKKFLPFIFILSLFFNLYFIIRIFYYPFSQEKTKKVYKSIIVDKDNYFCEPLESLNLYVEDDFDNYFTYHKSLKKGKDNLSIKFEKDKLVSFATTTEFKYEGFSSAEGWEIISNDENQVHASFVGGESNALTVDHFALDKNSGLAIWTRIRNLGLFRLGPEGFVYYFKCY